MMTMMKINKFEHWIRKIWKWRKIFFFFYEKKWKTFSFTMIKILFFFFLSKNKVFFSGKNFS